MDESLQKLKMSLNQILCVKIPEEGNRDRAVLTCRIVDRGGGEIDIKDWTVLSLLSDNPYEGMTKEVFNIQVDPLSQNVLLVLPSAEASIEELKAQYSDQVHMIFLDPGLDHSLLLFYSKFKGMSLRVKTAWQGEDVRSYECVTENDFICEIIQAPVSELYLSVLSNSIEWKDVQGFITPTSNEEAVLSRIQLDVYKTNYILNQWKSRVSQEEAKYSDFF